MAKFYIEKLVVSGSGRKPSSVEFSDGLNFIVGPSNTGKSYIVESIDYLFGLEPSKNKPFRFDPSLGYDTFKLFTRTPAGGVVFERKLGENKIELSGTDPNFEYGKYSLGHSAKRNISSVWLQMIGIDEPHKILQSQAGKTQQLTWRSFLHMFLIKQDYVARTQSVLYNPEISPNMATTPAKAAALFLMTGKDAAEYEVAEDKKIHSAKRMAVMVYIRDIIGRYAKRERELQKTRSDFKSKIGQTGFQIEDIQATVDDVDHEITNIQQKINSNIEQSKQLMHGIYANNGRLAECDTVADRFTVLRNQYQSDIGRLIFVINGNLVHSQVPKPSRCPFCDGEIETRDTDSYIEASCAELSHIRVHLTELEKAERDIVHERTAIESKVKELEDRKSEIDVSISTELIPQLTVLKEKLGFYRYIIEINKELEVLEKEARSLNLELSGKETEEEPIELKHDINQFYDSELLQSLQEKLIAILNTCHYEGATSARLNMETFDLEIGGRPKALSNGGGYCGFLNTVLALAFLELLEDQGEFSPGFLIVDSPITQLSEPEHKLKRETHISGLLDYLISIYASSSNISRTTAEQIIIIEHKDRLRVFGDNLGRLSHVNVIEFTQDKDHGRYGFLEEVFQY
jgi:hypothetical protein